MLPSQRLHAIHTLQTSIKQSERRHAPRSEQRRELVRLVAKQIRSEHMREQFEFYAGAVALMVFAVAVVLVIP
jgi:hypothetical protein